MSGQIRLSDALRFHKQASEAATMKAVLLKAAANYIIARNSGDVEFTKAASADLAAVITHNAMLKEAGVGGKILSGAGRAVARAGQAAKSKGLVSAGYSLQRAGVPGGSSGIGEAIKNTGRRLVTGTRKALGRTGRSVVRAAGKAAPTAAAGAAGVMVGRSLKKDKKEEDKSEEKKAALRYLLGGR